jgi:uncharacterized peroxidase-related enzyme
MNTFKIHTENTALSPADQILGQVRNGLGFIPNVFAVIAESAPALGAFVDLNNQLANSSLTATERELVQIATSVENECRYCVAGHTAFAALQNVSTDVVDAARAGGPIPDNRLDALHRLTLALLRQKAAVDQDTIEAFFAAGYGTGQLMEVILGICVKIFSNLTSAAVGFPLDDEFAPYTWTPEAATVNNTL